MGETGDERVRNRRYEEQEMGGTGDGNERKWDRKEMGGTGAV